MAFHCNVCGCDLSGDYDKCPVCEKVNSILRSFKAPDFVPPVVPAEPAAPKAPAPAAKRVSYAPVKRPEPETRAAAVPTPQQSPTAAVTGEILGGFEPLGSEPAAAHTPAEPARLSQETAEPVYEEDLFEALNAEFPPEPEETYLQQDPLPEAETDSDLQSLPETGVLPEPVVYEFSDIEPEEDLFLELDGETPETEQEQPYTEQFLDDVPAAPAVSVEIAEEYTAPETEEPSEPAPAVETGYVLEEPIDEGFEIESEPQNTEFGELPPDSVFETVDPEDSQPEEELIEVEETPTEVDEEPVEDEDESIEAEEAPAEAEEDSTEVEEEIVEPDEESAETEEEPAEAEEELMQMDEEIVEPEEEPVESEEESTETEEELVESEEESVEVDEESIEAEEEPLETEEELVEAEQAIIPAAAETPSPETAPRGGILEQHLLEKAASAPKKKKGGALFAAVIVLLTILLGVCTAVYVAVPLIDRHAEEQAAESYMDYAVGSWMSEYFAFKDRPSECCVELLTITEDGQFVMDYLLPDADDPDGWQDGSWQSTYKVTGTVKIDASSQRLMLLYDENDVSYFYDRYFVSMDEGEMYLREYYDEAHTSYYDVCFKKVA